MLALGLLVLASRPALAHGDMVIASGTSPSGHYGWMLSVAPYPLVTGPTNFSLLVFDVQTSAIVNTVAGEVYLATPDAPRPCCDPTKHRGPFPLLLEPFQYGDYIAYTPIDEVGPWEVQFRLTVGTDSFAVVAPFEVVGDGGWNQAAIQVAVEELTQAAQNPANRAAQTASPLAQPTATAGSAAQAPSPLLSPLPTPTLQPVSVALQPTDPSTGDLSQRFWLIGGGISAIVVGLGWLGWRRSRQS